MANTGQVLWTLPGDVGALCCVVTPGCAVVVLTVEQGSAVLVREAYPDRATAGERARMLKAQFERDTARRGTSRSSPEEEGPAGR